MTKVYVWRCGCGLDGRGEENAQEHGAVCPLMGYPLTNPYVDEQRRKR